MAKPKAFHQARALELQEDVAAWLGTTDAFEFIRMYYVNLVRRFPENAHLSDMDVARGLAPQIPGVVSLERRSVEGEAPIFCTSGYVSMLLTMAESVPKNTMAASDLTQSQGLLVFEEPAAIELDAGMPPIEDARALTWYVADQHASGRTPLAIRVWKETRRTKATPRVPGRSSLFPGPMIITNVGSSVPGEDHIFTRILQSHFALLKSPLAADEPAVRDLKISPRTKRSLNDDIRRVYLRNPEYARYEADEAAAAREGRAPMRAHWVRGHWRNQFYSKASENKWIWIDGYIKGNAENGTVTTRKVGVARANPSELRELVGSK